VHIAVGGRVGEGHVIEPIVIVAERIGTVDSDPIEEDRKTSEPVIKVGVKIAVDGTTARPGYGQGNRDIFDRGGGSADRLGVG